MSVRDTNTIDYIYLEDRTECPVLVVSDPMGWSPQEEEPHMELLAEKLNTQLAFISTGHLSEVRPGYRNGEPVWIEIAAQCSLSRRAESFFQEAAEAMADANVGLRLTLLS